MFQTFEKKLYGSESVAIAIMERFVEYPMMMKA